MRCYLWPRYLRPSLCFEYCWCHQKYVTIHIIKVKIITFFKKLLTLGEETNLRKKQICCRMMTSSKTMVTSKSRSHDQSNVTWLMLKFLLKSKDVLYQVSIDLGEVKIFYNSFSDAGQKALSCLAKTWKSRPDIGLTFFHELINMFIFIGYITV